MVLDKHPFSCCHAQSSQISPDIYAHEYPMHNNPDAPVSAFAMIQKMLSAGIVVLHREQYRCRYLLLRSYQYWDFPKGIVEKGEAPFSAACREVQEETSLCSLDFSWGHAFFETLPYGPGKVARYYVASTPTDTVELQISPQLGRPEHDEFRWLDYRDAHILLTPRVKAVLDWAHALTGC